DIRGVVGKDLTESAARLIGQGYAALLAERGVKGTIAIGRDNRTNGGPLDDALVSGLTASGIDHVELRIVPTPVAYWALHNMPVAGSIQITGSHNPPEFNGFKLCVGKSTLHGEEIQHILKLINAGNFPSGQGSIRSENVLDRYVDDIAARGGAMPRKFKI